MASREQPAHTNGKQSSIEKERQRIFNMFMEKTKCSDEEFATDLLEGSEWNMTKAMETYAEITNTTTKSDANPSTDVSHMSTNSQTSSKDSSNKRTEKYLQRGWSIVYDEADVSKGQKKSSSSLTSKEAHKTLKNADTTFVLPNIHNLPHELQEYIEYFLIDFVTLNILERDKYINWWVDPTLQMPPTKLWPLITLGDGNCLLHATSYSMWGEQDKTLELRMGLREKLKNESDNSSLYRRWRWQQIMSNLEVGLVQTEDDFWKDWQRLVAETTIDINEHGGYESLEEFHVYVLSNLLKRPIIVYSDKVIRDVDGNPLSPVPFGGIYLPLDCNPADCHKTPILLVYDRCHFSAVVPTQIRSKSKHADCCTGYLPLVNSADELFNVHYFVDPGKNVDWDNVPEDKSTYEDVLKTIEKYLDVCHLTMKELNFSETEQSSKSQKTVAAKLKMTAESSGSSKITVSLQEAAERRIMCTRLHIKLIENFDKNENKFIDKLRLEYEWRARERRLRDPHTIPLIAHRDYKSLSKDSRHSSNLTQSPLQHNTTSNNSLSAHHTNSSSEAPPPYSEVPPMQVSEKCKLCHTHYGAKQQEGMCSKCYSRYYDEDKAKHKTQPQKSPPSSSHIVEIPINREPELDSHINSHMSRHEEPRPGRFPTDYTTSYQSDYRGNPSIVNPYDRPSAQGHLERLQPTQQLSFGIGSLQMVQQPSKVGTHGKYSSSRYDDHSNMCIICKRYVKEYRELCWRCYNETRVTRRPSYSRVYQPLTYHKPGTILCKREGCHRVANNTGTCMNCMEVEAAFRQTKLKNKVYTLY